MTLDDELKRLGLLADAERSFNAKLDALENDPTPRLHRYIATRPQEGYHWNEITMLYEEGDELFRARVMAQWAKAMTTPRETVLIERGHGLDAIGARPEVDLPRNGIETDHDYRNRLIERMREADAPRDAD